MDARVLGATFLLALPTSLVFGIFPALCAMRMSLGPALAAGGSRRRLLKARFPADATRKRVVRALEDLGFRLVRRGDHISMIRQNQDDSRTPLTMPNHRLIKRSTLRTILGQAGISPEEFLAAYEKS